MKAKSKFSKVEVLARLLTQDINGKNLVVLSEECKASVMDLSQPGESYIYSIYIKNEDQNENSKWSHLSFDLKPDIDLCHFTTKDVDVFQWITKTNIYFLEILVDDLNERNLDNFWKILEHCLCSVVKKIPIDRAQLQCKKGSNKYIKKLGEIKNLDNHVEYMLKLVEERKRKEAVEKELIEGMKELKLAMPKTDKIINVQISKKIFEALGVLYNYDNDKDTLVILNDNKKVLLKIYRIDSQRFDYALCIETEDDDLISIDKICDNINGQLVDSQNSKFFCWLTDKCYQKIAGNCLGFMFDKKEESDKFINIYNKCNIETKTGQSYEEIEEKIRKYRERYQNSTNLDCFSGDEKEEEEEKEKEEEKEEKKEEKKKKRKKRKNREEIMDIDDKYNEVESSKNALNKLCIDSLANDRTFCVNDDNEIVVYKSDFDNDTIQKLTTLPVIQEYDGKNVKLNKALLYNSENNMLLLDENNPYVLYQYDLPKGKIISEWKTDKTSISDICSLKRNGQTTNESTIYGVNSKSVFTLDSRLNNNYNIGDIKSYKIKNYANKIMSTGGGQFVTGGEKGEIRFYDKIGIKAKNLFSYIGDPIRHIDISSDDQYLLLTFDNYLLLLNTLSQNGEENAFLKTINLDERRGFIQLQLKTSDVAKYGLKDSCFTPARFDLNENGVNNIITSRGEYIIIWNYNDIRKGKMNYKIKKADDLVIDNYFKLGKGNKIVIGMPTKVRIQNLKKIK